MILAHSWRQPILTFRPGRTDVVATASGNISRSTKTVAIKFKPIFPGIPTSAIPTRFESDGRLLSQLDTEQEVGDLNRRLTVQGFDPLTHDEFVEWVKEQPEYGTEMIFVTEDNTHAVGDEGFGDGITQAGDGMFTCLVCDNKTFPSGKGVHFHVKSPAHQAALTAARELQLEIA